MSQSRSRPCLVQFLGESTGKSCGYCNGDRPGPKKTIGAFFHFVTCRQYELLLERQWRRCGKYFYQPQNHVTCCPQYTIRLDCPNAKPPTRSHRRVLTKMRDYLRRTGPRKEAHAEELRRKKSRMRKKAQRERMAKKRRALGASGLRSAVPFLSDLDSFLYGVVKGLVDDGSVTLLEGSVTEDLRGLCCVRLNLRGKEGKRPELALDFPGAFVGRQRQILKKKKQQGGGLLISPEDLGKLFVAKLGRRREDRGIANIESVPRSGTLLIRLIDDFSLKLREGLERALRGEEEEEEGEIAGGSGRSRSRSQKKDTVEDVAVSIRDDGDVPEGKDISMKLGKDGEDDGDDPPAASASSASASSSGDGDGDGDGDDEDKEEGENEIRLIVSDAAFDPEEYRLYRKYQMAVHDDDEDDLSTKGYTRFLCDSALKMQQGGPMGKYGTLHIQYRVKTTNQLLAVSVVDVLPHGLSSVYFFYDPAMRFLTLGVYSALREIELIKQNNKIDPQFRYYYLGFYIHSCQKMRYKAQWQPSQLVCNKTWTWVDFPRCKAVLDKSEFGQFAPPEVPVPPPHVLKDIDVFLKGVVIPCSLLPHIGGKLTHTAKDKMALFPKACGAVAGEMQYFIDGETDLVEDVDPMKFIRK